MVMPPDTGDYAGWWAVANWPSQHIVKSSEFDGPPNAIHVHTWCGRERNLWAEHLRREPLGEGRTCESCFRNRERGK